MRKIGFLVLAVMAMSVLQGSSMCGPGYCERSGIDTGLYEVTSDCQGGFSTQVPITSDAPSTIPLGAGLGQLRITNVPQSGPCDEESTMQMDYQPEAGQGYSCEGWPEMGCTQNESGASCQVSFKKLKDSTECASITGYNASFTFTTDGCKDDLSGKLSVEIPTGTEADVASGATVSDVQLDVFELRKLWPAIDRTSCSLGSGTGTVAGFSLDFYDPRLGGGGTWGDIPAYMCAFQLDQMASGELRGSCDHFNQGKMEFKACTLVLQQSP